MNKKPLPFKGGVFLSVPDGHGRKSTEKFARFDRALFAGTSRIRVFDHLRRHRLYFRLCL